MSEDDKKLLVSVAGEAWFGEMDESEFNDYMRRNFGPHWEDK